MPFPSWVACGHTDTEIGGFGPSDVHEKRWQGPFWRYHSQCDLSEGEGRKAVQKQTSAPAGPFLQVFFLGGEPVSLWQANVKPLKIFQAKFNTLNSIRTAKQAACEDYWMQVCEQHEFVHDVV